MVKHQSARRNQAHEKAVSQAVRFGFAAFAVGGGAVAPAIKGKPARAKAFVGRQGRKGAAVKGRRGAQGFIEAKRGSYAGCERVSHDWLLCDRF